MTTLRTGIRRAALWGRWGLLMVPLTIVLHELGHLFAALALGFPDAALHFSSISHGDVTLQPPWKTGMVGLAGPCVTAVLAIAGCLLMRRGARWTFALAMAAASRFAVGVPYTIVNMALLLTGRRLAPPAFDEHKAATAMGWSGDLALAATSVILLGTLAWIGVRLPRGERMVGWTGLIAGAALGWALWMKVAGPLLLP